MLDDIPISLVTEIQLNNEAAAMIRQAPMFEDAHLGLMQSLMVMMNEQISLPGTPT